MDEQWWVLARKQSSPDADRAEAAMALIREGSKRDIFRQCSLGWHMECSDPSGDDCQCGCHGIARRAIRKAQRKGRIP